MTEHVILVDPNDQAIGTMEKMEAHLTGSLHRAFSVFIFNPEGQLLLQQRAPGKYHSGGKWTNTCCGHPRPYEQTLAAARRRLHEEMGIISELSSMFSFTYREALADGLTEHEFDHVFFGISQQAPQLNSFEAMDFKYMDLPALAADIKLNPDDYTVWLIVCFERVMGFYEGYFGR